MDAIRASATASESRLTVSSARDVRDGTLARSAAPGGLGPPRDRGRDEVAVHPRDRLDRDALGTRGFALRVVRARAEVFCVHLRDHRERAVGPLRLSLGE